jgi:endo-1,4-beta-xylanase
VTSSIVIVSVSSDEPDDNPLGADGATVNDIVIAADCKSVNLRSERDADLNGRVYTVTFRATDAHGNSSTATVTVRIPVNQSGAPAVDDGPGGGQTVNSSCP